MTHRVSWLLTLGLFVLTHPPQGRGDESLLPEQSSSSAAAESLEFFERKIRPVLVEHCYSRHSDAARQADELKADLLLDSASVLLDETVVVPGEPDQSVLIQALRYEEVKMPPTGKLADHVIADFEQWVRAGAAVPPQASSTEREQGIDWAAARQRWAFQPPKVHPLPHVGDQLWPQNAVDYFVLAALEERGLRPVRPATRREWLRRATFDLIGLPPTPEECDAFERDSSPEAYAKTVDRLLASPHYGERWARFWLDVARYADDEGNAFLKPVPSAYLYRDWVTRALNADMPYDEFVRLQIAGDEIPTPASDYVDRLAGLGYQSLGPQFRKGAAGEAKAKADELEDRIDTLTRGLLGLTVACARCHDHKFDPIPTEDYYALGAAYHGAEWSPRFFSAPEVVDAHRRWEEERNRVRERNKGWNEKHARQAALKAFERIDAYAQAAWTTLVSRRHARSVDEADLARQAGLEPYFFSRWVKYAGDADEKAPLLAGLLDAVANASLADVATPPAAVRQQIATLTANLGAAAAAWKTRQAALDAVQPNGAQPVELAEEHNKLLDALWTDDGRPFFVIDNELPSLLGDAERSEHAEHGAELVRIEQTEPPLGPSMPSVSGGGKPLNVFLRGNPENLGPVAPPGFLRILRGAEPRDETSAAFTRLDLAHAISGPHNPLTARVIVNRVWHYHFGRGIVATLSNFGQLGSPPAHPELLDTLAVRFVDAGWSLKWLHREIMLSATYRASSVQDAHNMAVDPGNEFLWRATPRRLDIEAWRDAVLSAAGQLDPQVGGPTLDQANPGLREEDNFEFFTRLNGQEADRPGYFRRTLYSIVSRHSPNATLALFDFPEPNVASEQRNSTTIPQQQLFILNSDLLREMSRRFAARVHGAPDEDGERLRVAWQLAFGRPPSAVESAAAEEFLQTCSSSEATADEVDAWQQLAHALLCSNEFMFLP